MNTNGTVPSSCARAADWLPAVVPGTVHTDLMANGVIPDPFYRMNENDVQWIDQEQWIYRKSFDVPAEFLHEKIVRLRAEGLDTYAEIRINGKGIGKTANMFVEHTLNVKRALRAGTNSIEILFDSPVLRSKALERRHGALRVALEPHRVYVRKAQYSFSWDWGPKLTTSGIWRPIFLEAFSNGTLKDPFVKVLSADSRAAVLRITADVEGIIAGDESIRVAVTGDGEKFEKSSNLREKKVGMTMKLPRPKLWWPNGQGEQPMYSAQITLLRGEEVLDERIVPFAVRTIALLQEKDDEGKTFQLVVNGRKIFCKGADWIPADNFLPRVPDSRYETLLRMAQDAHMNMIRVWGGGIYEDDRFYDLCDRLGLLVWQDFMFACGEYPDQPWFFDAVRTEAERAIKRLRNHPSLALWCGNNECEWLFCMENPGKHPDQMHGATIFRDLLAGACREFDGTRPYWRSSPFGNGFPNDESNGNHHQWQVWSAWKDFSVYENDRGRFVTEFGFQAPANVRTIEECTLPEDRHPQSPVMEHHNKQIEGTERLMRFLSGHYRVETDWRRFTYLAQLVQAEALKTAVEHWRRRMFKTAGALFWQINDCWPVSSWAVIDSALRPKAGYFYAKRFFAPLLLSFQKTGQTIELWVTNDSPRPVSGAVALSRRSFDGTRAWETEQAVRIPANSSRKVLRIDHALLAGINSAIEYLFATWKGSGVEGVENRYFFAEPKHMKFVEPRITKEILPLGDNSVAINLEASTFVKSVRLELAGEDAVFEDNYFDLDAGGRRSILLHTAADPSTIVSRLNLEYIR